MSPRTSSKTAVSISARRMRFVATSIFALAPLLLAAGTADAAVYKWVDASGRVVYSDQPPPGNVKSEIVNSTVAPADPAAVRDMANKDLELKKRVAQRADEQKATEKLRADEVKQRENCMALSNNLKAYQGSDFLYTLNEKGERIYMDDALKQKERERIEAQMREAACVNR